MPLTGHAAVSGHAPQYWQDWNRFDLATKLTHAFRPSHLLHTISSEPLEHQAPPGQWIYFNMAEENQA